MKKITLCAFGTFSKGFSRRLCLLLPIYCSPPNITTAVMVQRCLRFAQNLYSALLRCYVIYVCGTVDRVKWLMV